RLVPDPYRWLEDTDGAATRCWTKAQQALAAAELAALPGRAPFRALLARAASDGPGVARWGGDRTFVLAGQDRLVLSVREPDGRAGVVVDPVRLDPSGATTIDGYAPSPDGELVAYQVSRGGTEDATLTVL